MLLTRNKITYIWYRTGSDAAPLSRQYLPKAVAEYCALEGTENHEVCFTEAGKPYFPGFLGRHLSVTHSGDFLLFAFAPFPIGVDAEREGEVRERVSLHYFSPFERTLPFSQVWTSREAVSKLTGVGLAHALKVRVTSYGARLGDRSFALDTFSLDGFCVTAATEVDV